MIKDQELNNLMRSPGFAVVNITCGIKDELRKAFASKGYDITLDQFAVLIQLWNEDGLSQTEICEKTLKTKSNVTRILDSMGKKDLIFRRMNEEDRRSFQIFLTEKGKSMKEDLIQAAIKANRKIFQNIVGEDEVNLIKMLNIIANNLR